MAQASSDRPLNERVVDFLYVLMRQVALPGDVEGILQNHVELSRDLQGDMDDTTPSLFSNKGLEQYAREIAARLNAFAV